MIDFTLSVTDLARFCHRSGDIDHRFTPSPSGAQGIAGHQRLYRRRPATYQSEFAVELNRELGDTRLLLRGRADGYDPARALVEEIKTCRVAPDAIPEAVAALHLAQGRLYAAVIAQSQDLPGMTVQVTWLNIDSDEEHALTQQYTREELEAFLAASLEQFAGWLQRITGLRAARNDSLDDLAFPHDAFRDGQRDIAELVYKCVDQRGQLLVEAPTGIGKTAAVLYPALKALARGKHYKLVFVTAKTVGRLAAQDTLALFERAGYRGTSLSLTAKDSICLAPGKACHGDDCPYARGYYDKLPRVMPEAIQRGILAREDMEELGREFELCPYELARDLAPWVDVITGDLHYVYGLGGMLGAAMENGLERWTVLADEAHNLPDRARGMYSARLAKARLMAVKRETGGVLARKLEAVNRQLLALDKLAWQEDNYHSTGEAPAELLASLQGFTSAVSEELANEPALLQRQPLLADFYFDVLQFQRVAEQWGDDFRCRLTRERAGEDKSGKGTDGRSRGKQSLSVQLACLDPARLLGERHARCHALVAFSATLSPLDWSRDALGLDPEAVIYRANSPFTAQQLQVRLATGISTRFRDREHSAQALAQRLSRWLEDTPGNCIVYFPSYAYMASTVALLATQPGRTTWMQHPGMDDTARRELPELLAKERNVTAFCILGGVFGEGIDLPGDQLQSVAVVGVGMPQVNRDTRELQDWYEARYGRGFEYAFIYPGMQKVAQAMGRVVRGAEDHGTALLVDSRYRDTPYRNLLPIWWSYAAD